VPAPAFSPGSGSTRDNAPVHMRGVSALVDTYEAVFVGQLTDLVNNQRRLLYPPSATALSATIAIAVHYRSTGIYQKEIAEALPT
jgi:hypothetical protein